MEQKHGFIHDMLDIKVLVLFALAQLGQPTDFSTLLELCMQDDGLGYIELSQAVAELTASGHIAESENGLLSLTAQGVEHEALTRDSLALPLSRRVIAAADACLSRCRRESRVSTGILENEDGTFSVTLSLESPVGRLLRLELPAETQKQARSLRAAMYDRAELLYTRVLSLLIDGE